MHVLICLDIQLNSMHKNALLLTDYKRSPSICFEFLANAHAIALRTVVKLDIII